MKERFKLQKILLMASMAAMGFFLFIMGRTLLAGDAHIMNTRKNEGYQVISSVSYKEFARDDAPLGVVKTYRFPLDSSLHRATHLAFYTIHQYVDVYLGEEHIYSIQPNPKSGIRTAGSNWTMLPLYPEDMGKEVTVCLTPVYKAYQDFSVEFLAGSGLSIYVARLSKDLPQLIVCGLAIICGLFTSVFGVVWHFRKHNSKTIIPLGLSAIGVGIWRLFDTTFSPFMAMDRPTLLFIASISMLMLSIIPLVITLVSPTVKSFEKAFHGYLSAASGILLLQMLFQAFGIVDLRDTLSITHILIIIGAVLVITSKIFRRYKSPLYQSTKTMKCVSALFVLGAMTDLALYYIFGNSSNLLFTLITFVIYVIFRGIDFLVLHNNTKKELAEKEKLLMNVRITMMFSQIRSHFIFNILNAISGMCKYDPQKADETIIHFARYLRTNVETINNDQLIPFQSSLRQLTDYVTLEQVRFEDKIRLETDIAVEDFLIPPLILQPIVENAIRHGIIPKDSGGTITLKTFVSDGNICIVIADDGVGFRKEALEKSTSVALKNVRFRLQHMIGGTMQIESRVGEGTTVTITIPWKEEQA